MDKIISGNYEQEIKTWYETQVLNDLSDTLTVDLKDSNDFLAIQNFILLYQKNKKIKLNIICRDEDVYRIKHYLYLVKDNLGDIKINGEDYTYLTEVKFFGILPLIEINKDNYEFLSSSVYEIFDWKENKWIIKSRIKNNVQQLLAKVSINALLTKIKNCKDLSNDRIRFFNNEDFYSIVKRMPFLAFLLFSIYDRVKHEDIANERKDELKRKSGAKSLKLQKEDAPEAYPNDEEIRSDMFNAWDISDGLLQLIENVVEYAGNTNEKEKKQCNFENGQGVLSIRIHKNDLGVEHSYLEKEYSDYFSGYENVYKNEYLNENNNKSCSELDCYNELHEKKGLGAIELKKLSHIVDNIEKRKNSRNKNKHFLDVRIADASGKCMTEVFQSNIKKRGYRFYEEFNNIQVRSFFDPDFEEQGRFERYYQKENLIYHYGLQIFSSVILNNDGYFTVRSHSQNNKGIYSTVNNLVEAFDKLIEGTRYHILLPFRAYNTKATAMINSNINYYSNIKDNYKIIDDQEWKNNLYNKMIGKIYTGEEKEEIIRDISVLFSEKESEIPVFDISVLEPNNLEILCKAIILYITQIESEKIKFNCALINCETFQFINIIRIFAVFYDKNGQGSWMKNAQIYLNGKDTTQEFLISGDNISILLQRVEKLAFSRKIHPECLQILRKMLERRQKNLNVEVSASKINEEYFAYTPFDLIIEKDGVTIFEKNVKSILEKDIQMIESGCKIEPIHARLGSKIHIDTFYEAELLFYNNYYTNRFAYLMAKRLINMNIDAKRPICFVGYETYSEMLLCEMKNIFEQYSEIESTYIIYEIEKEEIDENIQDNCRMRYIERMIPDSQVVFVVPINTTLTTFNKLHAALKRRCEKFETIAYMGVIQIRDTGKTDLCTEMESQYWDDIDVKKRLIESKKLLGKYASYQVCVKNHWEDPLKCKMCFPSDVLFEQPLIETDKASVVPTQLIGLKENSEKKDSINKFSPKSSGSIESLKNYFYCNHIYRGENHYNYYIRTATYLNDENNKENIRQWLLDVKQALSTNSDNRATSFDIIVNPMHFSSTAFVELVNDVVFNGASYVLRIESEKEFRDNMRTKYSDLTALYKNLKATENNININFHYVDDNIITGKSFNRVKHLIDSLFPFNKDEHIKINIFSDIIVLLNRLSGSSIHSYISDIEKYFSYIDLRISSLRNHGDACFLCKRADDAEKLAQYASTNAINANWESERRDNRLKSLSETKKIINKHDQKENFIQMLCTHEFNTRVEEKGALKNDPFSIYKLVLDMVKSKPSKDQLQFLYAYLQVISYPFAAYRKSIRECALQIIIILLELFVMEESIDTLIKRIEENENYTDLEKDNILNFVSNATLLQDIISKCKTKQNKEVFLKLLIQLSVELKSNYIIREDRIESIISFADSNVLNREEFSLFLISQVKKLISLSSDEAKGVYLEKELNEILEKKLNNNINIREDLVVYILIAFYMENTRGVYDAIMDLSKTEKVTFETLQNYYYENYKKILEYNGIQKVDEQIDISNKFLKLYKDLDNNNKLVTGEFNRYIEYYNIIAKDLKELLDLEKLYFLITKKERILAIQENNDVDFIDGTKNYDIFAHSESGNISLTHEEKQILTCSESDFYLNTFYIKNEYCVIVLKKQREDDGYFKSIYLLVKFKEISLFSKYKAIRWCLIYRNKMLNCFENDFSNNIIQNWIETSNIIKHLRKARAFMHSRDQNDYDPDSVWAICKHLFYGTPKSIRETQDKYFTCKDGFILELMTDIRLGRINMLLLSDVEFQQQDVSQAGCSQMLSIKGYIEAIKNAFFWKNIVICNKDGIERGDVLDNEIESSYLEKNRDNKYSCHNEYLIYLIYEALHSAVRYGYYDVDGKIHIQVYKEKQYLCIKNKIKDDFNKENIKNGLARKGNGISLATICEYIIREYSNRRAKIIIDTNSFTLALPIFTED